MCEIYVRPILRFHTWQIRANSSHVWQIRLNVKVKRMSQVWKIRTYMSHLWRIRANFSQMWQIRSNNRKNQRRPTAAKLFDRSDFFGICTTRHCGEHSDQDLKQNPTSGLRGDAIKSLPVGNFTKSEPGTKRSNLSTDRNFLLHLHN